MTRSSQLFDSCTFISPFISILSILMLFFRVKYQLHNAHLYAQFFLRHSHVCHDLFALQTLRQGSPPQRTDGRRGHRMRQVLRALVCGNYVVNDASGMYDFARCRITGSAQGTASEESRAYLKLKHHLAVDPRTAGATWDRYMGKEVLLARCYLSLALPYCTHISSYSSSLAHRKRSSARSQMA